MRGREEHHSLKIEQFRLEIDENGLGKTRNKGLNFKQRLISPKMGLRIKQKDVRWHFSYHLKVNVQLICKILAPFTLLLLMLL